MTTSALLAIDLALSILSAGSWYASFAFTTGPLTQTRARAALALSGAGTLLVAGQALLVLALVGRGWWFAQEKISFALPLTVVATIIALVLAVPALARVARRSTVTPSSSNADSSPTDAVRLPPAAPTALFAAGSAAAVGVLARTVVGYPLEVASALVLLACVLLATALCYLGLAHGNKRSLIGVAAMCALLLVSSVSLAWMGSMVSPDFVHTAAGTHSTHVARSTAATDSDVDPDTVSVDALRTPSDVPGTRMQFTLRASTDNVTLASGDTVDTWSYGSLPGPELRVQQGDVVEAHLENVDIDAGVTIHWHGYDVPNGEDGVAGVTQDSVLAGESFDYRFVADQPGTYWYHTHQNASRGVQRGLYGTLIVEPAGGIPEQHDIVVPVHTIGGSVLLGASDREQTEHAAAGDAVRIRLINTDMQPRSFMLPGVDFRVVALDGHELAAPDIVRDKSVRLPAGGRADLSFTMPTAGAILTTDATRTAWLAFDAGGGAPANAAPSIQPELDLLSYGGGPEAALPAGRLVQASMVLDRNPRFLQGAPNYGYTVNGAVYPQIPSINVELGDVVELTVANRGWETHPMHVHGHHVVVLSRNGIPSTGSQLVLDTFDVRPGEVWVVSITANNPGLWMDHCHNLDHAAEGMMMALRYTGVTTPYEHGGNHGNKSE